VSREIGVAVDLGGDPPRFVTVRLPLSEEIGEPDLEIVPEA
jgi:hypothetical protein